VIKKGGAWLKFHEQVKIAVWASPSSGDRAEHGDPMSLALPRNAEDLRAAAPQPVQGQNVIGHVSSVSPRRVRFAICRLPRSAGKTGRDVGYGIRMVLGSVMPNQWLVTDLAAFARRP